MCLPRGGGRSPARTPAPRHRLAPTRSARVPLPPSPLHPPPPLVQVVESIELHDDRPLTKQLRQAARSGKGTFLLMTFKEVFDNIVPGKRGCECVC